MSAIDFGSLDLIPKLLSKLEQLENEVKEIKKEIIPDLDLTTRKGVRKYLNVSDRTITALTSREGDMREGVHYIRKYNGKKATIRFIANAIMDFKKQKG